MTTNLNSHLQEILALPVSARIQLVEDIWDSIAAVHAAVQFTNEQAKEIDRRLKIIEGTRPM